MRVASEEEFAAAATVRDEKKAEALGGGLVVTYAQYAIVDGKGSECHFPAFGFPIGSPSQRGGPFEVREHALVWKRDSREWQSLPFGDIADLLPSEHHKGFWYIPLRKADGACLFLTVGTFNSADGQEHARSSMLSRMHPGQSSAATQ